VITGLVNPHPPFGFSPDGRISSPRTEGSSGLRQLLRHHYLRDRRRPQPVPGPVFLGSPGFFGMVLDRTFPSSPYMYSNYALRRSAGRYRTTWNDGSPNPSGAPTTGMAAVIPGSCLAPDHPPATRQIARAGPRFRPLVPASFRAHSMGDPCSFRSRRFSSMRRR